MRSMRTYIWLACFSLVLAVGCEKKQGDESKAGAETKADVAVAADEADKEETLAVALPAGTDLEGAKAFGEAVTKSTGITTTARAYPTFADTLEALRSAEVQVAVLDAWPYYTGHHKADLTVLAAEEDDGAFEVDAGWYVRADSKVDSLEGLAKKRIMFGGRDTAAGFLFAIEALLESEVIGADDDPTKVFANVEFAATEEDALKALVAKRTDAVSVSAPTLAAFEGADSVKLLTKIGPVPTRALAIKSMTDEETKKKVRKAFTELDAETSKKLTGVSKWAPREHFEYAEGLQRASEKTLAEYPLKEEVD